MESISIGSTESTIAIGKTDQIPYTEEDDDPESNRPLDFELARQLLNESFMRFSKQMYYRTKDGVKIHTENENSLGSLYIIPMMTILNIMRLEKRIDELEKEVKELKK